MIRPLFLVFFSAASFHSGHILKKLKLLDKTIWEKKSSLLLKRTNKQKIQFQSGQRKLWSFLSCPHLQREIKSFIQKVQDISIGALIPPGSYTISSSQTEMVRVLQGCALLCLWTCFLQIIKSSETFRLFLLWQLFAHLVLYICLFCLASLFHYFQDSCPLWTLLCQIEKMDHCIRGFRGREIEVAVNREFLPIAAPLMRNLNSLSLKDIVLENITSLGIFKRKKKKNSNI